jgi:hypothetical protein
MVIRAGTGFRHARTILTNNRLEVVIVLAGMPYAPTGSRNRFIEAANAQFRVGEQVIAPSGQTRGDFVASDRAFERQMARFKTADRFL